MAVGMLAEACSWSRWLCLFLLFCRGLRALETKSASIYRESGARGERMWLWPGGRGEGRWAPRGAGRVWGGH